MKTQPTNANRQEIVNTYFSLVGDLREGVEESVEKLMDLWDPEGTFEFCGSPPVNARFDGRNAIHVLYKNRLQANGMPLKLTASKGEVEAALGLVQTRIHRTRELDDRVVAGWTTVIGVQDGRGYQVSGSHSFGFRDGKIASLKVVVSPRAESAKETNLTLEGLDVDDIGRLSLAAWAVV